MLALEEIRSSFPAIAASGDVLLDNAGGSQVPRAVAEAMCEYLLTTYVQLGADYATSQRCTATVDGAHHFINLFMNGLGDGHVVLSASTTVLCNMLADCIAAARRGRDELIVAETAHEANAGPWFRLADRGFKVHLWRFEPESLELSLQALGDLLCERTRLVAFPYISNILGRVEDARAITQLAHDAGAQVVIDAVAYAPHRAIDVHALQADWLVYSTYKVFGPHMAALFGTNAALEELEGPNHFFIPRHEVPYKFEPGGPSHEGCAGLLALWPYLARLAGADPTTEPNRAVIERAYQRIAELETALQVPLIEYLRSTAQVRLIGPAVSDATRVPTISFVHERKKSVDIARAANRQGYGIRYGHFYAYRLCAALARQGVLHDVDDGVVRVSALHYNTPEEITGLIACLDALL